MNPALALILQKSNDQQKQKSGRDTISSVLSARVPMSGQLSNHFVEGMRKIYELEPFIKLDSLPLLSRSWHRVLIKLPARRKKDFLSSLLHPFL